MPARLQRSLVTVLLINYIMFGVAFYTERTMSIRLFEQLITMGLLIAWLVYLWRTGQAFPRTPLDRPILLLGLAWLASAITARDARVSVEYAWPILVYILAFYWLVDFMRRGRQRWLMEALFTVSAVVVVISVLEAVAWYFGIPLLPDFSQSWPAIAGFTRPPGELHKVILALNASTVIGNFTATMIPLAIAWAISARLRDLKVGLWLLVGGLGITLLLSGSRGALMSLAVSTSVLILANVLRDDLRRRFPRFVRLILSPRWLLPGAAVVGILFIVSIFSLTVSGPLNSGDLNRLDLWRSAIAMFHDHPILGVGPYQYGAQLRWYGYPDFSWHQDRLAHAHNFLLNLVAEGGVLALTASVWLAIRYARTWWQQWQQSYPGRRRRLEGGLAALLGFGVHNLVDTFTHIHLIIPILIIAAYMIAGDQTRLNFLNKAHRVQNKTDRRLIGVILIALLAIQIVFIPIHTGNLAFSRSRKAVQTGNLPAALDQIRQARRVDPALNLYPLHEAYVLGLLAAEDRSYLEQAVSAYETSQTLNPTWDTGWHNLAALYAQAGRIDDAISAEQTAIEWNPAQGGYHLKLGEYLEAAGQSQAAQKAYREAIRRAPGLASSGFWNNPLFPERPAALEDAIEHLTLSDQYRALVAAIMAADSDRANGIAQTLMEEPLLPYRARLLGQWATWANDDTIAPCPECFYYESLDSGRSGVSADYAGLAEIGLSRPEALGRLSMTTEQAARASIFVDNGSLRRGWYILAQLAIREGADDETIDHYLWQAVRLPSTSQPFSSTVYGRVAAFFELPQARYPRLARYDYEPWILLANRYEQRGDTDNAAHVYRLLLELDPYLWEATEGLQRVTGDS